ncbi:MAG: PEP-CTERM sorting domain-containing protein [Thermoguttaceae bacterium]
MNSPRINRAAIASWCFPSAIFLAALVLAGPVPMLRAELIGCSYGNVSCRYDTAPATTPVASQGVTTSTPPGPTAGSTIDAGGMVETPPTETGTINNDNVNELLSNLQPSGTIALLRSLGSPYYGVPNSGAMVFSEGLSSPSRALVPSEDLPSPVDLSSMGGLPHGGSIMQTGGSSLPVGHGVTAVPEPGTLSLLLAAGLGLLWFARRKRK